MTTSLYDLTTEMLELSEKLSEFDGDVTDEDKESEIDALLESFGKAGEGFKKKVDSYIYLVKEFQRKAEIKKQESKRLAELSVRDEKNAERLETRLSEHLKRLQLDEVQTDYHKLKFRKNGGKLPVLYSYLSIEDVPDEYTKTARMLAADAVREALEAGEELPFAKFGERGEKLKIS